MVRYLMFFSYFGNGYSGIQSQVKSPVKTVQCVLMRALKAINGNEQHDFNITLASRTDKDVHAFCNAIHLDLNSTKYENQHPDVFTSEMNEFMQDFHENIAIIKTIKVPDNFNARYNAMSRSYVYRLGVMENQYKDPDSPFKNPFSPYPLFEQNRCMFITRPFNMDLVKEASKLFCGRKDFRAFTTSDKRLQIEMYGPTPYGMKSEKTMDVQVHPGNFVIDSGHVSDLYYGSFKIWNIMFKSSSYIYKQIRKMTSAMVAVGLGQMTLNDIEKLLDESTNYTLNQPSSSSPPPLETSSQTSSQPSSLLSPSVASVSSSVGYCNLSSKPTDTKIKWNQRPKKITPVIHDLYVPPQGLYLSNIEYPKEIMTGKALEFDVNKTQPLILDEIEDDV